MGRLLDSPIWKHLMAVGLILWLVPGIAPDPILVLGGSMFGVGFIGWLFTKAGGPV